MAEQDCISVFTCNGIKIRTFSLELFLPHGVTVDCAGNILVTDSQSHCIRKFTPEGEFLTAVGRKGSEELEFDFPTGIGINHKNKKVYICDRQNNRVQILNEDFTFSSSFDSYEEFEPLDVAFDSTGNVYIVHSSNQCIRVFTPEGRYLRKFGKRGSGVEELDLPSGICIDSNDIVYVTERNIHRVSMFTNQGEFVQSFRTKGEKPGESNEPCGIAVDTHGLVYVSDTKNNRVQGFKNVHLLL